MRKKKFGASKTLIYFLPLKRVKNTRFFCYNKYMSFKIDNIEIKNRIVMAPMAGISNSAYRRIIKEMGAGLIYTEMISAEALVRGNKKTLDMLKVTPEEMPLAIQIFGSEPKTMAKAAKIVEKACGANLKIIIDINMGCPVPKIAIKNQAGAALMKDPKKVKAIVSAVVEAVRVPVTVKIRSGWDEKSINAVEIAKIIEECGAKAITVHARTRAQGYSGKADWKVIKAVKEAVSIPVIGNGDVTSYFLAKKMLDETGCDWVMVARGMLGNPWLIKECVDYLEKGIEPKDVTLRDKINMMRKHYQLLMETKNEKIALLEIRSHVIWYLKGMPESKKIKLKICQAKSSEEIFDIINNYEKKYS